MNRHEWYQTATHVIVTLFVKNVKQENAQIDIKPKTVSITFHYESNSIFSYQQPFD